MPGTPVDCELYVPDSSSGAIKHYQRKEKACEPCKKARARYLRIWRATSMEYIRSQRLRNVRRMFDPKKMEEQREWFRLLEGRAKERKNRS